MEDIRRVHYFRHDFSGVTLAADAQEGRDDVVLKVGDGNKRISCRVIVAELERLSSAFAQMAELDSEESPFEHAILRGSGRLRLETGPLEVDIDSSTTPSQVSFTADSRSSETFSLTRVTGDGFRELALFFGDIARALQGAPREEHDDSVGPRSRPSPLADSD